VAYINLWDSLTLLGRLQVSYIKTSVIINMLNGSHYLKDNVRCLSESCKTIIRKNENVSMYKIGHLQK
jgi:hypothetical protein